MLHGGPRHPGPPIYLRSPMCPRGPKGEGGEPPWSTTHRDGRNPIRTRLLKISIDKLRMRCRQVDLRVGELEPVIRVLLALGKLVTGELPGHDRIATNNALNAFIMRWPSPRGVELAEIGNLLERQCCATSQTAVAFGIKGWAVMINSPVLWPLAGGAYCHRR